MIGIKSMEFILPEKLYLVKDLDEVQNLSPQGEQIYSSLELDTVSIIEDADSIDLAAEASEKALTTAGIEAFDLQMIIFLQSRSPAYLMSSEATRVQERLGAKQALAFTITDNGCANINTALQIACNQLKLNDGIENILICAGSKPFGTERYREATTVIGDAGMGVVVGRTDRLQIVDIKTRTDGKFWDLYKIDYKHMLGHEYKEICTSPRYKFELSIASRNNFSQMNQEIIEENHLVGIDAYIMQNLSISAFKFNEDALKLKFAQICYDNCKKYGHLGSIDILLNLQTGLQKGEIKNGDYVLLMNNSPVACWSSMVIKV